MSKREKLTAFCIIFGAPLMVLVIAFGQTIIVRISPLWAWRYGTPEMKVSAARQLVKEIRPGEDFEAVFHRLAPGSKDRDYSYDPPNYVKDIQICFDVRASFCFGIEVNVRDNRVVSADIYD